jgi:prepilin-type N-terminal cleavage/methylation domain-containing protein
MTRRSDGPAVGWSGVTLVELLVVLTILGLILAISGVALASLRAPREAALVRALREARAKAIRTGKPVRVVLDSPTVQQPNRLTAFLLPDGRAIGPGLDPLTGAPSDAGR